MSYIKRLLEQEQEIENAFPDDTDWNAPTSDAQTEAMIAQMEQEEKVISMSGIPSAFANMYR
jgi:hypothetical protein